MNSLDIFGKMKDKKSTSTTVGGLISIISFGIVLALISNHLLNLKSDNLHRELKIDFHKLNEHMDTNIDVTLYNAPANWSL
jgi:hypothetical protein